MKIFLPWRYPPKDFDAIDNFIHAWTKAHKFHVMFHVGEVDKGRYYYLLFKDKSHEVHFRMAWDFELPLDFED